MTKKQFKIEINAPREKVWNVLLGEQTYPQWTSAFSESSRVKTDWKKGSKALFHDGNNNGMISEIAENIPNQFLSIKHLGEVTNGIEDTTSEKVKQWSGAFENYTLKSTNGKTELIIDMDIAEEYVEMFSTMWPKALQKVKEISEK
jgi:hypothetical protein